MQRRGFIGTCSGVLLCPPLANVQPAAFLPLTTADGLPGARPRHRRARPGLAAEGARHGQYDSS